MNRKTIGVIITAVVLLSISGCSDGRPPVAVDKGSLGYFQGSYDECRKAFIAAAEELKGKYRNVSISSEKIPGSDGDLAIDTCYIPAQKSRERIILLLTGVHGIEGFAGSAVQQCAMKELIPRWDLDRTGVLLVHGINPYGFKHMRRVTERNVDLNRNFAFDKGIFKMKNVGYTTVYGLLNPAGKADPGSLSNRFFPLKAVYNIVKFSMKALRDAALKGQYEYEKGIYYGGKDFEPQKDIIDRLVGEAVKGYRAVFAMEVHTGYGERNKMHLYPDPEKDKRIKAAMVDIFKGYKVDWGDEGDFYATTGDLIGYLEAMLSPKMFFVPMMFEVGTMDSQTTLGSIRSIHIIILENQGAQYGYSSPDGEKEIRRRYLEAYYPESEEWRSEVIRQVREMFPVFVDRFQKYAL